MTRIEEIRAKIQEANHAYWVLNKPILEDSEYDRLFNILKKLSPNDPLITQIADPGVHGKVKHIQHMYSLDKVYSAKEVVEYFSKIQLSPDTLLDIEPKYDGLSGELVNGRLITRGDGEYGTDITHLVPYIEIVLDLAKGVPVGLKSFIEDPVWKDKRIVGELLIPTERFNRLKAFRQDAEEYRTERNMVAGFCNLKPDQASEFTQAGIPMHVVTFVSHEARKITVPLKQLLQTINDNLDALRMGDGLPCDGLVIKIHDREYAASLGFTQHHPKGQMALKFSDDSEWVYVEAIEWNTAERHCTPVAIFNPVKIGGVWVSRATMHSANFIEENRVVVGSKIQVERRGGVIPKIIKVINRGNPVAQLPKVCPTCDAELIREGAFLSCPNESCRSKVVSKITRGLEILGIKGIGPSMANIVVSELMIPDLITWILEVNDIELLKKKNLPAGWIRTITDPLNRLAEQGVTASTLLQAMCIPKVGKQLISMINRYAGGVVEFFEYYPVDRRYDLLYGQPGVHLDSLTNLMVWMETHNEEFNTLLKCMKILPEITSTREIKGVVCFTGAGPYPRTELVTKAQDMWYDVTDNIGSATVLVCADPNGSSSKLKKARSKGISIKTYDEFFHT